MTTFSSDVIVVGGGPSGVAAALALRKAGVERVTVLDREPYLGGATRHCLHSPFGMLEFGRVYIGAAYGRRLEREVAASGIDLRLGHSVAELGDNGEILVSHARGVETLTARRILVATGARETPRSARLLSGDRPIGVVTTGTLQSYVTFHGLLPFRRPLIVGSELVSYSAVLTCLTEGARPVAMIEPGPFALARAPLPLLPRLVGIPFHTNAELVDIRGQTRVEAVTIRIGERLETLSCDGVLLTGRFTPESSLLLRSPMGVAAGSAGAAVDQDGRCVNPLYFAAGNVLRAVETGGWAFREGRAIGRAMAQDLKRSPDATAPVPVFFDEPVKLVVPSLLRPPASSAEGGLHQFQLRFLRRARGTLSLELDGASVWRQSGPFRPERRLLVPFPADAWTARRVHFRFKEEV